MKSNLWDLLLHLKERIYSYEKEISSVQVSESEIEFNNPCENKGEPFFNIFFQEIGTPKSEFPQVFILENGIIEFQNFGNCELFDPEVLKLYLPFCLAPIIRQKVKKPLAITHFAQTLDGYIATLSNHSKWIGNDENLIHAHRIRAMVDAIVIGNNTLLKDQPKLNVRHVSGKNPHKIVIGNTNYKMDSLLMKNGNSDGEKVIRISSKKEDSQRNSCCDYIQIDCEKSRIPTEKILKCLFEKKIYSVLIEGGSFTSSIFLKEGNIDILQLHIAPILFGSGIKTFCLPEIKTVGDAWKFENSYYSKIGDAMMFTGFLKNRHVQK